MFLMMCVKANKKISLKKVGSSISGSVNYDFIQANNQRMLIDVIEMLQSFHS